MKLSSALLALLSLSSSALFVLGVPVGGSSSLRSVFSNAVEQADRLAALQRAAEQAALEAAEQAAREAVAKAARPAAQRAAERAALEDARAKLQALEAARRSAPKPIRDAEAAAYKDLQALRAKKGVTGEELKEAQDKYNAAAAALKQALGA